MYLKGQEGFHRTHSYHQERQCHRTERGMIRVFTRMYRIMLKSLEGSHYLVRLLIVDGLTETDLR